MARAAVDILAAPLGGQFAPLFPEKSDKGTVEGEAADVTVAFGKLLSFCREALEDDMVDVEELTRILDLLRQVKAELNQLLDVVKDRVDLSIR